MSAIGCLFSAVFLLLKSSGTICFVCTGIIAAEYGLFALISESSTLCNFHFINLFAFLDAKEIISNYLNLNILEYPVNRMAVFVLVCAVLTAFSMTTSVIAFSFGSQIKKEIDAYVSSELRKAREAAKKNAKNAAKLEISKLSEQSNTDSYKTR